MLIKMRNIFFLFFSVSLFSWSVFATTPSMEQLEAFVAIHPEAFTQGHGTVDRHLVAVHLTVLGVESESNVVTVWQHALEVFQVLKGNRPAAFFSETDQDGSSYGFQRTDATWAVFFMNGALERIEYTDDRSSRTYLFYKKDLNPKHIAALQAAFVERKRNSFESYLKAATIFREGVLLGYSELSILLYANHQKTTWHTPGGMSDAEIQGFLDRPEAISDAVLARGLESLGLPAEMTAEEIRGDDRIFVSRARGHELYRAVLDELAL